MKLEQVLEVMTATLKETFSARDEEGLLTKLAQRRGRGYQLGKSGM